MAPLSLFSIATLLAGAFVSALGSATPIEKRGDSVFYTVQDFKDNYGYNMLDACYYVNTDGDTDDENCLINQHFVHDRGCISVRGSECETESDTSKILNARLDAYEEFEQRALQNSAGGYADFRWLQSQL